MPDQADHDSRLITASTETRNNGVYSVGSKAKMNVGFAVGLLIRAAVLGSRGVTMPSYRITLWKPVSNRYVELLFTLFFSLLFMCFLHHDKWLFFVRRPTKGFICFSIWLLSESKFVAIVVLIWSDWVSDYVTALQ